MGSLTVRRLVVAGAASALVFTGAPAAFAVDDDGGRATATQEAGKEDSGAVERNSGLKIDLEKRFGYKPYSAPEYAVETDKNLSEVARTYAELWQPDDFAPEDTQEMGDVDVERYHMLMGAMVNNTKDDQKLSRFYGGEDKKGTLAAKKAYQLAAAVQWSHDDSNLQFQQDWRTAVAAGQDKKPRSEWAVGKGKMIIADNYSKQFQPDQALGSRQTVHLEGRVPFEVVAPASIMGTIGHFAPDNEGKGVLNGEEKGFRDVWSTASYNWYTAASGYGTFAENVPAWTNFKGKGRSIPKQNEIGKPIGDYWKKAAWAVAVDFDPELVNQDPEKVLEGVDPEAGKDGGTPDAMAKAVQALVDKLADGVDNDDPDAMLKQREGTNFVYPTGRLDQSIKNTRKALDEDPMSDEARESLESYVEAMEKLKEAAEAGEMDVLPADGDGVSEVKRTSEDSSGPMEAADSDADESDADEDRGSDDSDSTETSTPSSTTTSAPAEDDEGEAEEETSTSTPAAPPASETSTSETSTTEAPPADEAEETTSSAPSEGRDIPDADKAGTDAGGDGFDLSGLEIDAAELVSEVKPNTVAPQVGDKYETTTNSAWRLKPFRTKDQTDAKIALTMQKVQEANPGKSPEEVNDLASQAVKDNLRSYKVGFVEDISPGHSNKGDVLEVVAFLQPATEQEKAASGSDWHQTDSYTDKSMYVLVKWSGGDSEDANRNDYYYALHANFAYDNDDVVRRIP